MKVLLHLALLIAVFACSERKPKEVTAPAVVAEIQEVPPTSREEQHTSPTPSLAGEFKDYTVYLLSQPLYEDFNGDAVLDTARFIRQNNKAGVLIRHGNSGESVLFGGGVTEVAAMGDDFSWVDFWGVVKDSATYNILVEGGELVGEETFLLVHPSIFLRKEEVGGGIITFKEGAYQWVHQSD